jgi:hypothetical protein
MMLGRLSDTRPTASLLAKLHSYSCAFICCELPQAQSPSLIFLASLPVIAVTRPEHIEDGARHPSPLQVLALNRLVP